MQGQFDAVDGLYALAPLTQRVVLVEGGLQRAGTYSICLADRAACSGIRRA